MLFELLNREEELIGTITVWSENDGQFKYALDPAMTRQLGRITVRVRG
jgi:hypothetical protein